MYIALYRKYRPTTFNEVVGQDVIVRVLKNAITNKKMTHAYLFCGPRGTGKTSVAKIFAKTINCNNLNGVTPCDGCVSCTQINNHQTGDIIEIDAASNNGVDEIRELKSKVNLVPSTSNYKIYIIDEVHMLTVGAFNALLKTLEEPPAHIIFIFATTEPHKIPTTILSRCQRFDFKKISENRIFERLKVIIDKENIEIDDDSLKEIARLADGGLRDAISILDQVIAYSDGKITIQDVHEVNGTLPQQELTKLIEAIIDKEIKEAFQLIDHYNDDGKNLIKLIEELINFLKNLLIYKTSKNLLDNINNIDYLKEISEKISNENLFLILEEFNNSINEMKNNNNPKMILELLIIKLMNNGSLLKSSIIEKKDIVSNNIKKEEIVSNNLEKEKTNYFPGNNKDDNSSQSKENLVVNNINNNVLKKIIDIRINNAFSAISKQKLIEMKKYIGDVHGLILDPKYGAVASIILDGDLKAVGLNYLIFVYETERLANIFNQNILEIEELIHLICKTDYKVIATHSSQWDILRKEYKSKSKKYTYIEENYDIKKILDNADENEEEIDNIKKLFGQIVEYK